MDDKIREAIRQADQYIKTGEYGLAWRALRPYQEHPEVHRRLVWLKKKHAQLKQQKSDEQLPQAPQPPRKRIMVLAAAGVGTVALLFVLMLASNPGSQSGPPANGGQVTSAPNNTAGNGANVAQTAAAGTAVAISQTLAVATITENPQERTLQDEAKLRVGALSGVTSITTLDIDVPTDEAPLVYAELVVNPESNNTALLDSIRATLSELLNVTQYSDFDVIVSDGSQTIEYIYDAQTSAWTANRIN